MPRSPHQLAVAAFGYSFFAVALVPLSLLLALLCMASMPRGLTSALTIATCVALGGGGSIALAIYGFVLAIKARRSQLPKQPTPWAVAAMVCYFVPCLLLLAWLAICLRTLEGEISIWIAVPPLVAVAGIAWPIYAARRYGLNSSLLPPLAMPLAGVGLCFGVLGILTAFPLYGVQRSCGPSVYSFDGRGFVLDCEPYAGAIAEKRAGYSRLNHLRPVGHACRLKMVNDLDETQYTDELRLLVVDHPLNTEVVPDASGHIHTIASPIRPTAARELPGTDVLDLIGAEGDRCWESALSHESGDGFARARSRPGVSRNPRTPGKQSW